MQTPFKLDIWLQSYERFDNAKNNMKEKNLKTVFANISKTTSRHRLIPLDHVTYLHATLSITLTPCKSMEGGL